MAERNLDFDKVINRKNTRCLKYDFAVKRGKPADVLPLWVADMDFETSSYVEDALVERAKEGIFGYSEVQTPYFDILAGCSSSFDLWETKYYHVLDSHKALVEWVKGTRLRPYLAFLGETAGKEFEKVITDRVKRSYPVRKSGDVVFGFRRLFFTAKK